MDSIKLQVREGYKTILTGIPPKLTAEEVAILTGQIMSRVSVYDESGCLVKPPHTSFYDTYGQSIPREEPKTKEEIENMLRISTVFRSPATENFIDIDGKTYATDPRGKGLYRLVEQDMSYFQNEAIIIDDSFILTNKSKAEYEIRKAITSLLKS